MTICSDLVTMGWPVKTRVAPSPTGAPHVGTAYVALFNKAFAHSRGGKFILRIEDTDRTRSKKEYEEQIFRSLDWLGLGPDEKEFVRQSDNVERYQIKARELVARGRAYYCYCESHTDYNSCTPLVKMPGVIRFKAPKEGFTAFNDLIRGAISFENKQIDDKILLKSDGFPTYHLASVVDDREAMITHVIRAEEWISSTPLHLLLYEAFGWTPPSFAHLPLLRNSDGSKISKRKNPVSLTWYEDQGYLPEALLNFLGLMGFSMKEGQEVFSFKEFRDNFSFGKITVGAPVFDLKKLDWLNGKYIRAMSDEELHERVVRWELNDEDNCSHMYRTEVDPDAVQKKMYRNISNALGIMPLLKPRMRTLKDFVEMGDYFWHDPVVTRNQFIPKLDSPTKPTKFILNQSIIIFNDVDKLTNESFVGLEGALRDLASDENIPVKEIFRVLRIAITGKEVSPPIIESIIILGKRAVLRRLNNALEIING